MQPADKISEWRIALNQARTLLYYYDNKVRAQVSFCGAMAARAFQKPLEESESCLVCGGAHGAR